MELEGVDGKVGLMELVSVGPVAFPRICAHRKHGEMLPLPPLDTISFGRIGELDGVKANDIVIKLGEERLEQHGQPLAFRAQPPP